MGANVLKAIPFFYVYCRMRFLILGRSVGKRKKNAKIKLENCLELGGPVPQHNISGAEVNMAAMEERKIDFVVRIKRDQGKS